MKSSSIKYNPSLTVIENAKRNKVSENAIRKYIRTRNIDRNYDRKVLIIQDCKKFLSAHPYANKTDIAIGTKHSLPTIRKYWHYINTEDELKYSDTQKTRIFQRKENDYYATHHSIVMDLLRVEQFGREVLEPFAGDGSIAKVLVAYGYNVQAYDKIDRGYAKIGDFFKTDFPTNKFDIVTNPPYNKTFIPIVLRCLSIYRHKMALLLPLRYLAANERYREIYRENPPARVYVYVNRIVFAKNGEFSKYSRSSQSKEYAWYIWDRDYKGETVVKWIYNEDC